MSKTKRKKLKLNIRFNKGIVVCAKSPIECRSCKGIKQCEGIELFYYQYSKKEIEECFKNSDRRT